MRVRDVILTGVLIVALVMSLSAQSRPGDGDDNVLEVITQHEDTTEGYAYFGTLPEFAEILSRDENLAFFVPHDDVLEGLDPTELTAEEIVDMFNAHVAMGIATQHRIELITWFRTVDGERVDVTVDDDTVILNDDVEVVEAVAASNGIVYIIDGSLASP